MLNIILVLFIVCIIIGAPIMLLCFLISWNCDSYSDANKLAFKDFINFYNVNPDKWELNDGYVIYKKPDRYWFYKTYFNFGFFDYLRYSSWKRNKDKKETKMKQDKEMIDFLYSVNADIEKLINESNANAEKAVRDIYTISKRL